ncbi:protein Flattop [Latimeria chalumnae]|uniref:Protein Flattop n=1 Tax=Latimeria chalumnae TaxID=7897 RepID=M3XLE6_LATCH|nr:PREDICTED: protein Flattop [Latimeria chalumnae]|eukprot:XP_005999396.1 PREDICTED: protein Flattop [Latimeria chalumnae]
MAFNFSANQYENAFRSNKLLNWTVPKPYKEDPSTLEGCTPIIANDRGHLLPGIPRSKTNPWGTFMGTWEMPKKIPPPKLDYTARSADAAARLTDWVTSSPLTSACNGLCPNITGKFPEPLPAKANTQTKDTTSRPPSTDQEKNQEKPPSAGQDQNRDSRLSTEGQDKFKDSRPPSEYQDQNRNSRLSTEGQIKFKDSRPPSEGQDQNRNSNPPSAGQDKPDYLIRHTPEEEARPLETKSPQIQTSSRPVSNASQLSARKEKRTPTPEKQPTSSRLATPKGPQDDDNDIKEVYSEGKQSRVVSRN